VGVNNRQRRAAKKKARGRSGAAPRTDGAWTTWQEPSLTAADVRALLADVVTRIIEDGSAARRCADLLLVPGRPLTPAIARGGVASFLRDVVSAAATSGWSPTDLAEVTRRKAGSAHVPLVLGLLHEQVGHHAADTVAPAWREDLRRAGAPEPLSLHDLGGMQRALELLTALAQLPPLPPVLPAPGTQSTSVPSSPSDEKLLARVQALLAKAEATDFDEEADALAAKAQELVSRHALDRLLAQAVFGRSGERPQTRRLWLDAPYVFPKAMLVHVVADANRCRSVVSESLGCCTLVGSAGDLDAVEVLVPSLLVQAHVAMGRCGRQSGPSGTFRTRSFRQSFLLSYAQRIGERLRSADEQAAASSGHGGELVPLLARHREQVDAACDELFPETVAKASTANNAQGWCAGRAAADQARFGPDTPVIPSTQDREAS
jgi:hypothetical protein